MQVMAMLEGIKEYGQAHTWAALMIDGEEIISAGRFNWLHLSGSHSSKTSSAACTSTSGIGASPS
jgi:hypothetical protein